MWDSRPVLSPEGPGLYEVIADGIEAFRLTREYVGEDMLPVVEGWSWFDWCEKARRAVLTQPVLTPTRDETGLRERNAMTVIRMLCDMDLAERRASYGDEHRIIFVAIPAIIAAALGERDLSPDFRRSLFRDFAYNPDAIATRLADIEGEKS